jgi:hypothetical protein
MSTKYAYKELPPFNPDDRIYWQDATIDAVAERGWLNYLSPPDPVYTVPVLADDGVTVQIA